MRGRRPLANPLDRVVNVTVGLPERDLLRLQDVCRRQNHNYRVVLRDMVRAYLRRMDGVEEQPNICPYLVKGKVCMASDPPNRISEYALVFCQNEEEWQRCRVRTINNDAIEKRLKENS